jgi:hypothetical protein
MDNCVQSDYVFKVSEETTTNGCVLSCLNRYLETVRLPTMTVAELRLGMWHVVSQCSSEEQLKAMIGKDCLGLLEDDEACLPQVNFALQAKFGRQVTFKSGKKSMLNLNKSAKLSSGTYLLLQVCMQRVPVTQHEDMAVKNESNRYVHESSLARRSNHGMHIP